VDSDLNFKMIQSTEKLKTEEHNPN